MAKTTTRQFKAHDNILLHTIKRQAGTFEKSVLEGTMNSIEAGATKVELTLDCEGIESGEPGATFQIKDDGRGIATKPELLDYFEKFATPHEESECKTWAEFRMGRAQLFCFGKNDWRTSTFRMQVDIDKPPFLDYLLTEGLRSFKGTQIDIALYKNPVGRSVEPLKKVIKQQIEFMEVPVLFNGKQINTPASKCKWTYEDDDAYYLFGRGANLDIYNLGAFVRSIPASHAGVTGVVVSKKKLAVSVSRTEIIRGGKDACPVYDRIEQVIKANRIKRTRKASRRLERHERIATLSDLLDGGISYQDVRTLGLFETCNDRVMSLDAIRKMRTPWAFAERGNRKADKLIQTGQAVCLSDETLEHINYTDDHSGFFHWLLHEAFRDEFSLSDKWEHIPKLHRDFDQLTGRISDTSTFLPEKQYSSVERRILRVLESYDCWRGRRLCMGLSDCNLAWTDGSTYICIAREWLSRLRLNTGYGTMSLWLTLFHELSHDCNTSETHIHGAEFHRRYHDLTIGSDVYSPLGDALYFLERMKRANIDERVAAEISRQDKAKAGRDKALGLTDNPLLVPHKAVMAEAARAAEPSKPKPKAKRPVGQNGKMIRRKRY